MDGISKGRVKEPGVYGRDTPAEGMRPTCASQEHRSEIYYRTHLPPGVARSLRAGPIRSIVGTRIDQ